MPLILNGNPVSPGNKLLCNGTELQKIICNDVLVWQKYAAATASITGGGSTAYGGGSAQPTYENGFVIYPGWNYSLSSIPADGVIAWDGVKIKAKGSCTITVSGAIRAQDVDGYPCAVKVNLFRNNSSAATFLNTTIQKGENKVFSMPTRTIALEEGETCSVRVAGGHSDYSAVRTRFFIASPIRFVATPI